MPDRGHKRLRRLVNADRLPRIVASHLLNVLEFATGDLSSNVAIFLDVDGGVRPPSGELDKADGLTRTDLAQEPWSAAWDDAVMSLVSRCGPFPVSIWISQRVLRDESPSVFQTAVLAHECGHAHQIEQTPDLWDAWLVYSDFLCEKNHGKISRWYAPLEIDAELFGRRIARQFHPNEELVKFQERYEEGYGRVLRFEASDKFNLENYFSTFVRQDGPSGFDAWLQSYLRGAQGRQHRANPFLAGLARVPY